MTALIIAGDSTRWPMPHRVKEEGVYYTGNVLNDKLTFPLALPQSFAGEAKELLKRCLHNHAANVASPALSVPRERQEITAKIIVNPKSTLAEAAEYVRKAIDLTNKWLDTEFVDIAVLEYRRPNVPIDELLKCLPVGSVCSTQISGVSEEEIFSLQQPISAVQLPATDVPSDRLKDFCARNGIQRLSTRDDFTKDFFEETELSWLCRLSVLAKCQSVLIQRAFIFAKGQSGFSGVC